MATVLATGFSTLPTTEANAQGLFQRLFNPQAHRAQRERQQQQDLLQKKIVKTRVSAPKYLTYKPDTWKSVSLAALSEKKTAELQVPGSTSGEQAGAQRSSGGRHCSGCPCRVDGIR